MSTGAETRRPHLSVTDPVSHGLLGSDGDTGMSVRIAWLMGSVVDVAANGCQRNG